MTFENSHTESFASFSYDILPTVQHLVMILSSNFFSPQNSSNEKSPVEKVKCVIFSHAAYDKQCLTIEITQFK